MVYSTECKLTTPQAAVKIISIEKAGRRKVDKQLEITKLLKHPHIIELYDVIEVVSVVKLFAKLIAV